MNQGSRRWLALVFIALAQLMVALDATIVSIALPRAQVALGVADADRQWMITAYTLAFGSLLLLGGRLADSLGQRNAFLIGLAGFTAASVTGGAAPSFDILVAARAAQGAFAALLAPTALSLLAITFTEARERARAFAVYGAVAGSGAAVGMVVGGLLTQDLSWRWCLYVNVPVAVVAAVGGYILLPRTARRSPVRIDVVGAVLGTAAMAALVYACSRAVTDGWGSALVVSALVTSAVVLAAFVAWEARTPAPLLPLTIVLERNRAGAYSAAGFAIAGMLGGFLFLTYYMQLVLGFSPLQAGLAFLPITVASQAGSWLIAARLMPRVPPRLLMAPGALVAAAGMALLTQLTAHSGYLTLVLPAELLLGLGISCLMVPAFSLATHGVDSHQAGVAAAAVNTSNQVGGSLGTAVLNTIAASATAAFAGHDRVAALVHGYATGAGWASAILVAGAVLTALLVSTGPPASRLHTAKSAAVA